MNPYHMDTPSNWDDEAEQLEKRIEDMEKRESATAWVLLILSAAVFCLAVKVVFG